MSDLIYDFVVWRRPDKVLSKKNKYSDLCFPGVESANIKTKYSFGKTSDQQMLTF